ncbi:MAG: type II toxin-antitoxin system RelE/ParE family toxin [Alistipes sp.]|jgi:toxin ParE1/3/4|nr:type II toxin-antitoxin system RelE/ParE family toxin [Alistipes sp.]
MSGFVLSGNAKRDLRGIVTYTAATWSRAQADKYYNILMDGYRMVARDPARGKKYDGVTENLRGFRAGQHIIFYMTT